MRRIPKCRIQLVVCSMACLAIAVPVALADASFDGEYVGKRVLTNGPADVCPAEENISVTIQGNVLSFTNNAMKNYDLPFNPAPDGTFTVYYVDESGVLAKIQGRVVGGVLDADVNAPPCEHHWSLERK
jgi:hypothetical protein